MASREANNRTGPKSHPDKPSEDWIAQKLRKRVLQYTVDPHTGCWNHKNVPNSSGRVQISYYAGSTRYFYKVYRLSFIIHCGPIIDGYQINHRCDNGRCINPLHLYQGTQRQNVRDMASRYRGNPRGVPQLTEDEVVMIIVFTERGLTQQAIADILGISPKSVGVHLQKRGLKRGKKRGERS